MRETQRVLTLKDSEHRIIVRSLNDLRTTLMKNGTDTSDLNQLMLKVIDAPEKRLKIAKNAR